LAYRERVPAASAIDIAIAAGTTGAVFVALIVAFEQRIVAWRKRPQLTLGTDEENTVIESDLDEESGQIADALYVGWRSRTRLASVPPRMSR
jgi:hypothetical protein